MPPPPPPRKRERSEEEDEEDARRPAPSFGEALTRFHHPAARSGPTPRRTTRVVARDPAPARQQPPSPPLPPPPPPHSPITAPRAKKAKGKPKPGGSGGRYAPPSTYAHLSGIPDALTPNLLLVFCGLNPGLATAQRGHAYSHPGNLFWKLLHASGLTPDMRRPPTDDVVLPELYSYGNTNLVCRPTRDQAELSKKEMEDATPALERKLAMHKPLSVAVVGKGIWERIWKHKTGGKLGKEWKFGWQEIRLGAEEGGWEGARVFVTVSTSGLVAGYSWDQKVALWTELAQWVQEQREARGETAPRGLPEDEVREARRKRLEAHQKHLEIVKANGIDLEAVRAGKVAAEDADGAALESI